MLAQNPARRAAVHSAAMTPVRRRFTKALLLFALTVLVLPVLAGCSATPSAFRPDPSDPEARTPRAEYRSTIGRYTRQRPVTPSSWQQQNEQVTPAPKSGE